MRKLLFYLFIIFFTSVPITSDCLGITHQAKTPSSRLGIWITVFSPYKVLHTKENADALISLCKESGIDDIFLQVYRADKAYYDSDITDRTAFQAVKAKSGKDLIPYLLSEADKNGIKVHAWINLLSLAKNTKANIFSKLGDQITTKDQYGRTALIYKKDKLDKYYIRENQLFIDPGYPGVRDYLTSIAEEVIRKYPGFSGIHLDYVRYPAAVPFIPGSRFTSHGITYGYNWPNIKKFSDITGKDIRETTPSRSEYQEWDTIKRNNVTALVSSISQRVRSVNKDIEVSCTIMPSIQRTYLVTFQDWTRWLKEKLADFIVVMNYTDDPRLFEMNSQAMRLPELEEQVMIGVGAYLLKKNPEILEEQLTFLKDLSPTGIVIFSYDDIADSKRLQGFLSNEFGADKT